MDPKIVACKETAKPDAEGWILIQKRGQFGNPEDFFAKSFQEYEEGFGSVLEEFWIGLEKLTSLTSELKWELKVILLDWAGRKYEALFRNFRVGRYELTLVEYDERVSNIGGLSFLFHNGQAFSTSDKDQDVHPGASCSKLSGNGGWWYRNCYRSNLNGRNVPTSYISVDANSDNDDGITTIDGGSQITSYKGTRMELSSI